MQKKRLLVLIFSVFMISLLAGCGAKAASKKILKEDLYNSEKFSRFSEQLGMEITDLEVVKRQTDKDDRTDVVWVEVKAAGDTAEGEMYYVMTYNLYNDGWRLETITDDDVDLWHFEPLCGVPDDEIVGYMPAEAEILENSVDLEAATQTVTYAYEESHLYCDITYRKQLVFGFGDGYYSFGMNGPGTWGFRNEVDAGSYEDWHGIEGTWQYTDETPLLHKTETYTLTIDDFSPGSHAFDELEYGLGDYYTVSGSYRYDMKYYKDFVSWVNEDNMLDGRVWNSNGEMTHHVSADMVQHSDASYVTSRRMEVTIYYDSAPTIELTGWGGIAELTKIS